MNLQSLVNVSSGSRFIVSMVEFSRRQAECIGSKYHTNLIRPAGVVNRHFGYPEHPQNSRPAPAPFESKVKPDSAELTLKQLSVPTIDTFGCARFHPFGNGKPQKRAGPATRSEERRVGKEWRSR